MAMTVDEALRRGEEAWSDGAVEEALEWARKALLLSADDVGALDLEAHALAELGEVDAAAAVFERLIALEPKNPSHTVAAADLLVRSAGDDREALEDALELLDRAQRQTRGDPDFATEIALLRGLALNQLGEAAAALASLDAALAHEPDLPEALLERGLALFELGRLEEAARVFEALTREHPDEGWSFHYLGLIAERRGEDPEAAFARARALDPEEFPAPIRLSAEAFDAAVREAIELLPEHAKPALDNTIIDVRPLPSDEELADGLSPTILGVFQGTPLDERSPVEPSHHLTARISLFQNNLERFARNRDELIEEIRITVLHEVGHLLGLDEDELADRGLD